MKQSTSDKLLELARWVDRNIPQHGRPEQFHEIKSQIVHELRRIAREQAPHEQR